MLTGSSVPQDHIIASQMSRLNREMPISDVYHEWSLGLGLAPPLSKLLMSAAQPPQDHSDQDAKSASEDSFGNCDKLSITDDNQLALPPKPDFKPKPPPIPPKRFGPKPWVSGGVPDGMAGVAELCRRDDGDGRSMTDSHYSGYTPARASAQKPPELPPPPPRYCAPSSSAASAQAEQPEDMYAAYNSAFEPDDEVPPRVGSSEIQEYMGQLLGGGEADLESQQQEEQRWGKAAAAAAAAAASGKGHNPFQQSSC